MNYIDFIKNSLPREHILKFGEWAFGSDFRSIKTYDIPKIWNERHSDKLLLSDTGEITIDTRKMCHIYMKEFGLPIPRYWCKSWECHNEAEEFSRTCKNCPLIDNFPKEVV